MSKNGRRGAAVWALAFLSLLSALNVFNAVLRLTIQGSNSTAEFSLFSIMLGSINTEVYFWVSLILTFVLFGITALIVYRGFPADPEVLDRLEKLESILALNTNMLENTQMGFFRRLEENEKATDEAVRKISLNLEEATKNNRDVLEKQKKALQTVANQNKESVASVKKYAEELTDIRKKVKKIKKELMPTKPKLTSQSKMASLKGVKPLLAEELQRMGVTNIGEFLITDPAIIAQKCVDSPENVTNLQAMAQLMMVPGIDDKDAELLLKVGVTSRRELANQDAVQLCKAVAGIAKAYVEQGKMSVRRIPTIEDFSSWIMLAKT